MAVASDLELRNLTLLPGSGTLETASFYTSEGADNSRYTQ